MFDNFGPQPPRISRFSQCDLLVPHKQQTLIPLASLYSCCVASTVGGRQKTMHSSRRSEYYEVLYIGPAGGARPQNMEHPVRGLLSLYCLSQLRKRRFSISTEILYLVVLEAVDGPKQNIVDIVTYCRSASCSCFSFSFVAVLSAGGGTVS